NLQTPSYPPPSTPSYLFSSFHTTPGTTPIIFSTSNFSKMSTRKKQKTRGVSSSSAPPPVNIEEEPAVPVHQRQRVIDGARAPPPPDLA
ncbi:hypothetical protein LINGRAPRIM_LOCUS219, partial [Linum grandiflorum]